MGLMERKRRRERWTDERVKVVDQAVKEGKPRAEIVAEIQALPGPPIDLHHLVGYVKYHYGSAGLAAMERIKRRARERLNQPFAPVPITAAPFEIVAYAREVGIPERSITLAAVNAVRVREGRDPFVLERVA